MKSRKSIVILNTVQSFTNHLTDLKYTLRVDLWQKIFIKVNLFAFVIKYLFPNANFHKIIIKYMLNNEKIRNFYHYLLVAHDLSSFKQCGERMVENINLQTVFRFEKSMVMQRRDIGLHCVRYWTFYFFSIFEECMYLKIELALCSVKDCKIFDIMNHVFE